MTTYRIEGMTCNGCLTKVQKVLAGLSGNVSVTLDPPRAVFPDKDAPDAVVISSALAAVGKYSAFSDEAPEAMSSSVGAWLRTYYPLLLIFVYIAIASLAGLNGRSDVDVWMTNFMAGFFLVFSFFKLLDLQGFADSYAGYDLLAKRVKAYGYVYPFIEGALGLAYLFRWQPFAINLTTVIVMGFGSLGVIDALRKKQAIRCACLGTVLNLPMSTVTLVEDAAMVAMSLTMLLHFL